MIAFAQVTVPIFTVLMRRSFGVAGNNYATPRARPRCASPGRRPTLAAFRPKAASRRRTSASSPKRPIPRALRAELNARIESVRGPVGPLTRFQIEEMIDPRDTRRLVCEWVDDAYRVVSQPARLVPRALQFRP